MRVLHVIPSIAPRYGGPSTAIISMVTALDDFCESTSIATTDADGKNSSHQSFSASVNVIVNFFKRDYSETWKISFQLRKWLISNVNNYDLVHIHALWSFSTAVAAKACMNMHVPYVIRPAGMLSSYSWQHKGWKKQLYWRLLERKTIQNASAFHATSPGEEQDIKRVHADARVFVIPNGVEDSAFTYPVTKNNNEVRRKLTWIDNKPVILFLSRLHPKKGIVDRLLPAMTELQSNAQLIIVGDEDSHYPGYKVEVEAEIKKLNLSGHVHLMKPVWGNDRWDYLDIADLFVLPSHSENFGIVVAEAMARGCPVVTTVEVQSAPLVEEAKAGVIVDGESKELAAAIDRLLNKPGLRSSMASSGKQYSRENLRWDRIGKQIASMYSSILY
jgi:glycosyltransferase involved in cell wall biosynthesis